MLAQGTQSLSQTQHRANGIGVRVDVSYHGDVLGFAQRLGRRLERPPGAGLSRLH
jgi:hypothetical protein